MSLEYQADTWDYNLIEGDLISWLLYYKDILFHSQDNAFQDQQLYLSYNVIFNIFSSIQCRVSIMCRSYGR